jgi:hypothetical protein
MKKLMAIAAMIAAFGLGGAAAFAASTDKPGGGHTPVTICHKPGTPAEHTITVDDDAVPAHLDHGDYLGPCQGDDETDTTETETTETETTETETTETETTETETTETEPPTTTTETQPPRLCPDGSAPTPGEGAFDPNDDCARPPAPTVTTQAQPAPPTTTTATTTEPDPVEQEEEEEQQDDPPATQVKSVQVKSAPAAPESVAAPATATKPSKAAQPAPFTP